MDRTRDKRKAGLRLDQKEDAFKMLKSGDRAIVPGDLEKSTLVQRVTTHDPDEVMPPPKEGKPLRAEQIELLIRWVKEGAEWRNHWSFITPERPALPEVREKKWPRNEIDYFILERLEKEGLQPGAGGGQNDADPPRFVRPDRPSANDRRSGCVPGGQFAAGLREARGSAAGLGALRRTHGRQLAGPGALRGYRRLSFRRGAVTCGCGATG